MGIKKLLLVGIAALFLAAGTAHAIEESPEPPEWMEIMTKDGHDNRPWVAKCALHRTPSGELIEWGELCCKRYPNVPHCNGDYTRVMSLPRCAKLPHLANIKCAERILERKKKNARSH